MLHEDFTQTLNCLKTVATDQMTVYESEVDESNKKLEDVSKDVVRLQAEKVNLIEDIKSLQREN